MYVRIGLIFSVFLYAFAGLPAMAFDIAWPLKPAVNEVAPGVQKGLLVDQNEIPFLWNADTCWFLTFKASREEVLLYLDDRQARGIPLIQCMAIPWAREGDDNWFGEYPFVDQKFDQPNEVYWQHVDWVVEAAAERNMGLCMALAWNGCCREGWDEILRNEYHSRNDHEPLKRYVRFIEERYGDDPNVMFFLGGDSSGNRDIFALMGEELKRASPQMLIAQHSSSWFGANPPGMKSSTSQNEHAHGEYLDLSWTYTYWPGQNDRDYVHPYWLNHIEWNRNQNVPEEVSKVRPYILGESGYEEMRGSEPKRIRRLMHWNVICGAIGHGYGHGLVWCLEDGWHDVLDSPGAKALGLMRTIFASRAWWNLVPEQPKDEFFVGEPFRIVGAETFILSGQELYDNQRSLDEARGMRFVAAAKTPDGSLLMAYFPDGYSREGIEIDLSVMVDECSVTWIDPTTGDVIEPEGLPYPNRGSRMFSPPGENALGDKDWILVIETGE